MRGISTSASSAPPTMQVAQSASSTAGCPSLPRAAGRAGEEDHPLGVARDLVERLDHERLAAPVVGGLGDGGPQALVQLAAEGLDELALVLGNLDVALGHQHLAVSGLHA